MPTAQRWQPRRDLGCQLIASPIERPHARAVVSVIERVVDEGAVLTRDLGGKATTVEVGQVIASLV